MEVFYSPLGGAVFCLFILSAFSFPVIPFLIVLAS